MSRKQAICYLIIGIAVLLLALFVLAMINVWLMLVTVLLLVMALGLLKQRRPEIFAPFRGNRDGGARSAAGGGGGRRKLRPILVLVSMSEGSSKQIVVDKAEFTIGRGRNCDYVIRDAPSISRLHATIRVDHDRREAGIQDNESQNGTFVNNVRLSGNTIVRLSAGDMIQLGDLRFVAQMAQL